MINPEILNGHPVKKYSDKQIEKCKNKRDFIKNRLVNTNVMDVEYRIMIDEILKDYEAKLYEMEHAVTWVPYNEIIF